MKKTFAFSIHTRICHYIKLFFFSFFLALLSLLFTKKLNAQDCSFYNYVINGPYEEIEGTFCLSIKIHFLYENAHTPWLTQSEADEHAKVTLELLNQAYNEHGIFFVPPSCDSNNLGLANIYGVPNYGNDEFITNDPVLTDSNFIHIFYYPSSFSEGWSYSVPNNYLRISGLSSDPGNETVWLSETSLVIHGIGHCLGLLHPHENNCNNCSGPINCDCSSDQVCDTPLTINDYDCEDELSSNYMSQPDFHYCRNHFTPEQIRRIRKYLKEAPVLQGAQSVRMPGGTINYNNSRSIIVESGTLIINQPLLMQPDTRIIVKQGATLDVRAPITTACGKMWEGIVVEGSISATDQGQVFIRGVNASIENARCGIQTLEHGSSGIIKVWGSTFRNNEVGIRFYHHHFNSSNQILNANFTTDDDYLSNAAPTYIDIHRINGIDIKYSTFKDERSDCMQLNDNNIASKPVGIDVFDAGVDIIGCDFEDLYKGIILTHTSDLSYGDYIDNNDFIRCATGFETYSCSGFTFTDNDFDLKHIFNCPANTVGALLQGSSTGFTFEDNSFTNSEIAASPNTTVNYFSKGVICRELGASNNVIKWNDFDNIHIGFQAEGENGIYDVATSSGLKFTCNNFEDFVFDLNGDAPHAILVTSGATIDKNQDDIASNGSQLPTGNTFNELEVEVLDNENTDNEDIINYYYYDQETSEKPDSANNFDLIPIGIPNTNCTFNPPCNPCTENDISLLAKVFNQQKNIWLQLNSTVEKITSKEKYENVQDSIRRLRYLMDIGGNFIIQHYKSDTTHLQTDSILVWLNRLDSYSADYRLAKHYFFTKDWSNFHLLWPTISTTHQLNGTRLAEYESLSVIFDSLQVLLSNDVAIYQLPTTTTDWLKNFASLCDESAILARALLWQNGIDISSSCYATPHSIAPPSLSSSITNKMVDGIKVYPNPANQQLNIRYSATYTQSNFVLYNAAGQEQLSILLNDSGVQTINISHLFSGFYFYQIKSFNDNIQQGKVLIQH